MKPTKYKIGDRVQIVNPSLESFQKQGIVQKVSPEDNLWVAIIDGPVKPRLFYPASIKLVEPAAPLSPLEQQIKENDDRAKENQRLLDQDQKALVDLAKTEADLKTKIETRLRLVEDHARIDAALKGITEKTFKIGARVKYRDTESYGEIVHSVSGGRWHVRWTDGSTWNYSESLLVLL